MNNKVNLKEHERKALYHLKEELLTRFTLVDFRLFGSKARGDDTKESDIDIMIEIEEYSPENVMVILNLVYDIDMEHDSFVSPIILGRCQVEEGPLSESPIYKAIVKEGVPL